MKQQAQTQHAQSKINYKTVIPLAILPVILALYENGGNISGIIPTLTSGVFPVAFTLMSWGIAVQQLVQRKK